MSAQCLYAILGSRVANLQVVFDDKVNRPNKGNLTETDKMRNISLLVLFLAGCSAGGSGINCSQIKDDLIARKDRPDRYETISNRDGTVEQTWIFSDGSVYEFDYSTNGKCAWKEHLPMVDMTQTL